MLRKHRTAQVTKDGYFKTVVNHASPGGNADANDKEFNNGQWFHQKTLSSNSQRNIRNQEKFDITGDNPVDDDKELADKHALLMRTHT